MEIVNLEFHPGDLVPTEPGNHMVITQDMRYHECTAEFNEDEFSCFLSAGNMEINSMTVLAWAKIPSATSIVQALYCLTEKPASAIA